jgi:hypothetical protein
MMDCTLGICRVAASLPVQLWPRYANLVLPSPILPQASRRRPHPQEKCPGNNNTTPDELFLTRCI